MKRILPLLTCIVCMFSLSASAQWVPITNSSGTQAYGGVSVTTTSNNGTTGGGCGGQFWIQNTNSAYTFTFSTPVAAVWIVVDAINTGESIEFTINGTTFPITPCNLEPTPYVNPCSVGNCNIVNGQFVNNTAFWVCGGIMIFYGPITSFTISEPIGGSGTTFDISFVPMGGTIPGGNGAGSVTAAANTPLCEGNTLNLTSTVTGGTYNWTGPNGFTSTQQNPTINPITLAGAGDYIVSSQTPCGLAKDTVTVVVSPQPVISNVTKTDPTTCGGTDGTITLEGLAPNQPFTVTYTFNGGNVTVNLTSTANGKLIITGLAQGAYTTIQVVSGTCPAVNAGSMILTDPPIPAAPTLSSNSPVCENATINLSAQPVTGGTFNWTGPNAFVSAIQNPSIPNAPVSAEGNYSATVTVANCVSAPAIVFVDMTPLPLAPLTATVEYCQFSPAIPLTATGTALLWYTSIGGVGTPVAPTPNTNTAGTTIYYVTQTANACESPKASLNVNIKPKPLAPIYTGPVHFCKDDPATALTATGQNLSWFDNNNNLLPGAPTPVTSVPGDFTWYVSQNQNACESDKTTVQVHVADIPPAPVTVDISQCQFDEEKPLTAVGQALKWYNNAVGGVVLLSPPVPSTDLPTTNTWYVSQTIDGCESPRAPLTVTINFLPTSTFAASRPLVCENDTLAFFYTGNATSAETYIWTLPNDSAVLISGALNTPGPLVIRFDSIGVFPLTLNVDNLGCNTTYTYNVRVAVIPHVTISMPNDACIHDTVKVGLGSYNSDIASHTWHFDGGVNVFNAVEEGPYKLRWDDARTHMVDVTVSNTACETTTTDTIRIHEQPGALFTAVSATDKLCIGDSVRLAAKDNNGLYTYEWSPERFFNHSNNFAPVVNAYVMSTQAVTLKVTSPYGCVATSSLTLDAQSCCVVSVPNAFTPNGDGKNDIFKPITVGSHDMKTFMIVNRWGQKVFETVNENTGWDGTFNGADQNMDTYYYIMQYKCDGKDKEQKGEVILIR